MVIVMCIVDDMFYEISRMAGIQFDPEFLHAFARRFDVEIFKKKFKNIISECIKT